jgi:hypothetical protein
METSENLERVQGMMVFLGSLANGLELLMGRGSESVCFRSGRTVGLGLKVARREADPIVAMKAAEEEMAKMGINWPHTPFKKAAETDLVTDDAGRHEVRMAMKNCIVRCTLFRYGFPQKGSLCQTKHGLFCGLFDQIHQVKSTIEILHTGENACLLKLKYLK